MIYRANYRKGHLVSQNPIEILSKYGAAGSSNVPAQCFPFHSEKNKNCYLCTRVFLDGRPYYYPDVKRAIDDGKITNSYSRQLGLSRYLDDKLPHAVGQEPIVGFPILIHGLVAGVFVAWNYRSGLPESGESQRDKLDGRDIELLRRASHLMANYFKWKDEEEAGSPNEVALAPAPVIAPSHADAQDGKSRVSIRTVNRILDCITQPKIEELSDEMKDLNAVGRYYRDTIGPKLFDFLTLVKEYDSRFSEAMWKRGERQPTDWVSPTRCRCWVRTERLSGKREDEQPIFILAFQLELSTDETNRATQNWKNVYMLPNGKGHAGIATRPFASPQTNSVRGVEKLKQPMACAAKSTNEKTHGEPTNVRKVSINCFDGRDWKVEEVDAAIFSDDRHLSFLLSHISTYPYSFQQRPRTIGFDMMAEILEKDTNLPWFVAPLIVGSETQWQEEGRPQAKGASSHVNLDAEKQLVGYLTFDRKIQPDPGLKPDRIEIKDNWARFQNDLLHQMALFGACLAHQKCFENLVGQG
jgi:hypothetical protein